MPNIEMLGKSSSSLNVGFIFENRRKTSHPIRKAEHLRGSGKDEILE